MPRQRPANVKQAIVQEREYVNKRTVSEDVAEFEYKPIACKKTYRAVVLRKNLSVEKGEQRLFDDIVYFFYLTNKKDVAAEEIVWEGRGPWTSIQDDEAGFERRASDGPRGARLQRHTPERALGL